MTAVSIVVPTRDRQPILGRCLAALAEQRGLGSFEIVVVDDGSVDGASVSALVAAQPLARLVRRGGAGPAAARNAGVRAAAGDVICFTDDDCEPDPEWAARLVSRLETGPDAVGGSSVNGRPGDPFLEASELILIRLQASTSRRLPKRVFIPTNNLACRRSLLLEQPFDERYPTAAAEDRAWCASLAAAGYTLAVEPEAIVAHRPALGLRHFWRQHVRYGRGAFRFARTTPGSEWKEPPAFYLGLVRAGVSRGPVCAALVLLAQLATGVGYVREAFSAAALRARARGEARSEAETRRPL
jgi:glycosyltransferase involved in cell wall biosynthesis